MREEMFKRRIKSREKSIEDDACAYYACICFVLRELFICIHDTSEIHPQDIYSQFKILKLY